MSEPVPDIWRERELARQRIREQLFEQYTTLRESAVQNERDLFGLRSKLHALSTAVTELTNGNQEAALENLPLSTRPPLAFYTPARRSFSPPPAQSYHYDRLGSMFSSGTSSPLRRRSLTPPPITSVPRFSQQQTAKPQGYAYGHSLQNLSMSLHRDEFIASRPAATSSTVLFESQQQLPLTKLHESHTGTERFELGGSNLSGNGFSFTNSMNQQDFRLSSSSVTHTSTSSGSAGGSTVVQPSALLSQQQNSAQLQNSYRASLQTSGVQRAQTTGAHAVGVSGGGGVGSSRPVVASHTLPLDMSLAASPPPAIAQLPNGGISSVRSGSSASLPTRDELDLNGGAAPYVSRSQQLALQTPSASSPPPQLRAPLRPMESRIPRLVVDTPPRGTPPSSAFITTSLNADADT